MYNILCIYKQDMLIGYSVSYKCNNDFVILDDENCEIRNMVFCNEVDYVKFLSFIASSNNCVQINI